MNLSTTAVIYRFFKQYKYVVDRMHRLSVLRWFVIAYFFFEMF